MRFILFALMIIFSGTIYASDVRSDSLIGRNDTSMLLSNAFVQIEATAAVNALYNFDFRTAYREFLWLRLRYDEHPLPLFLLGLMEWWKIMPDIDNEQYDDRFLAYMDSTIDIAKDRYKQDKQPIESAFFLAAAYGFKGRLYSERRSWTKAAYNGKAALKYLEISQESELLSPELLFGEALFNYYSVWIPENYRMLKPIMLFFDKGDKELGIEQLQTVSENAFYTRTEAQLFLMRILANEEGRPREALPVAEYLNGKYPNNPYFHRYYARLLYNLNLYSRMEPVAMQILQRIDSGWVGYEANSGRYAAFYMAEKRRRERNKEEAIQYYRRAIEFARSNNSTDSGYYKYSLMHLGMLIYEEDEEEALEYFDELKKVTKKKDYPRKRVKKFLKEKN